MEAGRGASIQEQVAELCAALGPEDTAPPTSDAVLTELGLDSLACADLAAAVEERFGIRLADGDVAGLRTVGDVVRRVEEKVSAGPRIPPGLGRSQVAVESIIRWPVRAYTRMRIEGAENVPLEGPVVIAANHRSMLDVPVLVIASPRPMVFMAKEELFGDALRRRMWFELGGFPVRRQISDLRALDVALALLERGDAVGMFPEGTRGREAEMLPFLHGPAWLALRTGAPIVPCGIIGTGDQPGWDGRSSPWVGKHVRVAFGSPLQSEAEPDPRKRTVAMKQLTDDLRAAISSLIRL